MLPFLLTLTLAAGDPTALVRQQLVANVESHRCETIVSSTVDVRSQNDAQAIVDATRTSLVDPTLPGGIAHRITAHSRFTLERDETSGWRIANRVSLEQDLVDRFVAAQPAERKSVLAAHSELLTEEFVRVAAETAMRLVNQVRREDAADLARAAHRVAEDLGDPWSLAVAASIHGVAARYDTPRNHDLARDLSREAVALAERAGDADVLAAALVRKARADEDRDGKLDRDALERAIGLTGYLDAPSVAAHAAIHLSRSYESTGETRRAFQYAVKAGELAEMSGDAAARVSAAMMLGGAYMWIGEHAIAIRYFRHAIEVGDRAGFRSAVAGAYASLANAQCGVGQTDEALRTIEEGLARFDGPETIPLLRSRVGIHLTEGRADEAEPDLMRSIELQPDQQVVVKEGESALAWLNVVRGNYIAAAEHATRSRGLNPHVDDAATFYEALGMRCSGRQEEAIAYLEDELAVMSARWEQLDDPAVMPSIFMPGGDRHDLLIDMLVEQGRIGRALEVAELARGARLRAALTRNVHQSPQASAESAEEARLEERVRELNRALIAQAHSPAVAAALTARLDEARTDLNDFRQRTWLALPELHATRAKGGIATELPPRLDDVTILSFVPTQTKTFVFVTGPKVNGVRRTEVHLVPVTGTALEAKVSLLADLIEQRNLRASRVGSELYSLLIAPVEASLRHAKSLCIIPERALWRVPFHALPSPAGTALIERMPVFYAPSITMVAAAEAQRETRSHGGPRSFLAFANPAVAAETEARHRSFDPTRPLGALPDAEKEVRAIAAFYGNGASRVHTGADALESTLKREAGHYDILHIASHGLIHDYAPIYSSILLATNGDDEDGLLEMPEIAGLDLRNDLTVLSACETARSIHYGRGFVGLASALFAAGCPTTVVSLWSAQSEATSTLMIDFHRELAKGATKAEALRTAELRLRRNPRYRHLFYWAPFIVVGAP